MHFLMYVAEIDGVFCGLPAFTLLTRINRTLLSFILTEIQALGREHFGADGGLEVFVRQRPILIQIKFGEDLEEFLFGNINPPKLQIKLEFVF